MPEVRKYVGRWAAEGAALLVILFVSVPVMALVFGALQTTKALNENTPNIIPREITLDNIVALFSNEIPGVTSSRNFVAALLHDIIVAGGTTIVTLGLATFAAYAVVRLLWAHGPHSSSWWARDSDDSDH